MKHESTVLGLSPDRLAELLKIGSDVEGNLDTEHRKADLLHDWLAARLPLDEAMAHSLPAIVSKLCRELQSLAGHSFGMLLLDSHSELDALTKIKHYGKKMAEAAKTEADHDAATAVYYAAIASAVLYHDEKMTTYSYKDLRKSFSALAAQDWLTQDLSELFGKAAAICREKAGGDCPDT
jgi:hypothetical protein